MLKSFAGYALAGLVGCAAPLVVLWLARTDGAWAALGMVLALAVASALTAALMPARWLSIAVIVATPLCLVALVMFTALAEAGGYFWIWIAVAVGGLAAAFGGAFLGAREALRRRPGL